MNSTQFTAKSAFSGFSVNDQTSAQAFYTNILGLQVEDIGMGLYIQLPGGNKVFVYPKNDHVPATYTTLNFEVESIDEAVDYLTSKGVKFERYDNMPAPQDGKNILRGLTANQGPDIAWFKDPAGNILSVLQDKD
jgi:catechol 2,3-dioxygenase-like lactoylglutathione lyase family enzyme